MKKTVISCNDAPKAIGPYSQAISVQMHDELVYFSGQIGIDPKVGVLVSGGTLKETEQIFRNISALLNSLSMTTDNIIKTTVFVTDMTEFKAVNELYSQFFDTSFPARSCVGVTSLPAGAHIEVEIIAAR